MSDRLEKPLNPPVDSNHPAGKSPTIIGPTLVLKGELSFDEDMLVQGTLVGRILQERPGATASQRHQDSLSQRAGAITITGTFDGSLRGNDRVLVTRSAKIKGSISARRISLEDGVQFEDTVLCGSIQRTRRTPR